MVALDSRRIIGRSPEQLTLDERLAFAGKMVALEVYSPATLPLRRIEAVGDSALACARTLKERGLNPAIFEFVLLPPPF